MNRRRLAKSVPTRAKRARAGSVTTRNRWLQPLQRLVVLLLAVLGFLFCLLSGYQLQVQSARAVCAALLFSALFFSVFSFRLFLAPLLVCIGLAGLWVVFNDQSLMQGLLLLVETTLGPLKLHLPDTIEALLEPHDAQEAFTLMNTALVALLYPVTLLAAFFTIRRSSVFGLVFATLPLLIPIPFFSLAPALIPFFCLIAAYFAQYVFIIGGYMSRTVTSGGKRPVLVCRDADIAAQRPALQMLSLAILPVILLALLVSLVFLPERDYVRPEAVERLQQRILNLDFGPSVLRSNDGLTHGDLRNLTDIRFSGEPALKVRVSQQRSLYLRDFAGASYSSSGWESVSNATYRQYADSFSGAAPQNLHALAAAAGTSEAAPYSLSVQNIAANASSLWMPNGLVTLVDDIPGAIALQDAALGASGIGGMKRYSVEALPCEGTLSPMPIAGDALDASALKNAYLSAAGSALGLTGAGSGEAARIQSTAQAYIGYVFDAYTGLPEDTMQAAQRLCDTYGLSLSIQNGTLDLFETCRNLYWLLSGQCTYAYAPPTIPESADFTTYFLEQSRQGYCVHFATAATVLLRALGVPARYAEGYIVIPDDYEKTADAEGFIDIEDTHAHAWVELFDPAQLEWIPVEMTASSGSGSAASPGATPDGGENTAAPTPDTTPTPSPTPTPNPTPDPASNSTPSPSNAAEATDETDPENTPDSADGLSQPLITPTPAPDTAENNGNDDGSDSDDGGSDSDDGDSSPNGSDGDGEAAGLDGVPQGIPAATLRALLIALGGFLLLGMLVLAAFAWRRAMIKRRRQAFMQKDTNLGVLAACRFAVAILRFAGCAPLDALQTPADYAQAVAKQLPWLAQDSVRTLLELAQRARFSGKSCSKHTRDETAAFAVSLAAAVKAHLPRLKRFLFYWRYPV